MKAMTASVLFIVGLALVPVHGAAVIEDGNGTATGWGRWTPADPGIPERMATLSFVASTETRHPTGCPVPEPCETIGFLVVSDDVREDSRWMVTCAWVGANDVYLGLFGGRGDTVGAAGAYARDEGPLASEPDRFSLVDGPFNCRDDEQRAALASAATPLSPGDVLVADVCVVTVCPQDRA